LKRDLCITPPFARLLCQAQISILEILQCIPVVEIIAFLVLGQNWMFFKDLKKMRMTGCQGGNFLYAAGHLRFYDFPFKHKIRDGGVNNKFPT